MQISAVSHASPALAVTRTSGVSTSKPVSVATALAALANHESQYNVEIKDTKANIEAKIGDLLTMGTKLKTITSTDASTNGAMAFTLTGDQYATNQKTLATVFGKLSGTGTPNATYAVTGLDLEITGSTLKTALADKRLSSLTLKAANAAKITANYATLAPTGPASAITNADKISKITLTDTTSAIAMTGKQYQASTALLAKIKNSNDVATAVKVTLSDVKVTNVAAFNADTKITALAVRDTAANIAANLDAGAAAALNYSKVTSIAQTDGKGTIDVSYTNYQNAAVALTLHDKVQSSTNVRVTNVAAAQAASVVGSTNNVDKVTIKDTLALVLDNWSTANTAGSTVVEDTAAHISARFADLLAKNTSNGPSLSKIKITDLGVIDAGTETALKAAKTTGLLKKFVDNTDSPVGKSRFG